MTNEPQRHVRLRLARQRTAQAHVRARVRDEQPEPEPEPEPEAPRLRRAWMRLRARGWTHVITVVGAGAAALAAIMGLWFQAVATYWSQQTAKDQLNQSREDSKRDARQQATQVTFWIEEEFGPPGKIHVVNRSPDAVSSVVLAFYLPDVKPFVLLESTLRPCGEVVYAATDLRLLPNRTNDEDRKPLVGTGWDLRQLYFVDRSGKSWKRSLTSLAEGEPPLTPMGEKEIATAGIVMSEKNPQVNRVDACADGAK